MLWGFDKLDAAAHVKPERPEDQALLNDFMEKGFRRVVLLYDTDDDGNVTRMVMQREG